jgi:predicted MFS family arabinose efflux permease
MSVGRIDVLGAALSSLGLAGITYAIIAAPDRGMGMPVITVGVLGLAALVGFFVAEKRQKAPMLPLSIFSSRQFSAANAVTFAVYAAFGGVFFLLAVQLQVVSGFSALAAGTALLPITVVMLLLSARFGQLSQRIGPRLPMTVGPAICAVAVLMMARIGRHASYVEDVLPAVLVFSLGVAVMVAPLTATVLAAVSSQHAGVASGVNNAVARAAGLLAIAALPPLAGLSGRSYDHPDAFGHGFRICLMITAGLLIAGSALAAATIRNTRCVAPTRWQCPVEGPQLALASSGRAAPGTG